MYQNVIATGSDVKITIRVNDHPALVGTVSMAIEYGGNTFGLTVDKLAFVKAVGEVYDQLQDAYLTARRASNETRSTPPYCTSHYRLDSGANGPRCQLDNGHLGDHFAQTAPDVTWHWSTSLDEHLDAEEAYERRLVENRNDIG